MENEIQQKYLELQMMDQQIRQIQKNIETVENQISELGNVNQSLDELGNVKTGTEILVPVSGGVFAKAELKDNKDLIVNVGSNTTVKKSIPQTKKMIDGQVSEITKTRDELMEQFQDYVKKAYKAQQELEEIQKKEKK